MKQSPERFPSLAELEAEVLEEGREWMRRRLQQKLQALAEQHSGRRLRHRRRRPMRMRTAVGAVELTMLYGQDPHDRHWGSPLREQWGLRPNQTLSPLLEDRLCFTVTTTGSYEEAAALATKWGVTVDDALLHALVQRVGERAEALTQKRLTQAPSESEPVRAAADPLVLMIDGWHLSALEEARHNNHWDALWTVDSRGQV